MIFDYITSVSKIKYESVITKPRALTALFCFALKCIIMEVTEIDKKLYSILQPYDNWSNDEGEEKNLQAKKAVNDFYKDLLKYKPVKDGKAFIFHKRSFDELCIKILANIKQALKEQKYMRAANEIITLVHHEPGGRMGSTIHESLKKLLEAELSQ